MKFKEKDSVFAIAARDTGTVQDGSGNPIYHVLEDRSGGPNEHHESSLKALSDSRCIHWEFHDYYSLKFEAWIRKGYRYLRMTIYSGGLVRARGGRLASQRQRYPIS